MRSKVEYRRCGCGQLIGLRESCARCASAARARLHEAGIATMRGQDSCKHPEEQWHRHTDTCGLCGIALRKVRMAHQEKLWRELSIPKEAAKFTGPPATMGGLIGADCWAQGWGARLKAHQQSQCAHTRLEIAGTCPECGIGWNDAINQEADRLFKQEHEPPAVGAEVDYATALHDMQSRAEARYITSYGMCIYAWHNVLCYAFEGRMEENCFSLDELSGLTWARVPDGWSAPLSLSQEVLLRDLRSSAKLTRALPALGAEVSWSEAKADMQRRKEARYTLVNSAGDVAYRHEYAWSGGEFVTRVRVGDQWLNWQTSYRGNTCDAGSRWVRLA